jgi:hypothetical protein
MHLAEFLESYGVPESVILDIPAVSLSEESERIVRERLREITEYRRSDESVFSQLDREFPGSVLSDESGSE